MKKLFFSIVLSVCILLAGCSAPQGTYTKRYENNPFVEIGRYIEEPLSPVIIYYHTETKVMYVEAKGGFTVMLNADGTPMIWDGE